MTVKKEIEQNKSRGVESAELTRSLMRCAGTGIYIIQDGRFQYVNPLFQKLSGYKEKELLGVYALDLVHPEDRAAVRQRAVESLKTGEPFPYEYRFVKKNGEVIWVMERLTSTRFRGKRSTVGSFLDITERKQAEQALAKSEERYRTILEEMKEGYYETDLVGNYTFFNDVICEKLGYSREELMGMNFQVHTDPEDVKKITDAYFEVYRTGKPLKWFSPAQIRKDGTRIFAEDSVSLLRNESGEIIGFRGVSRDITERRRAEEALRQSEEKFRAVLEGMAESCYEVDLAGNFIFFNSALNLGLGYSREEMLKLNYTVYTPPEIAKKVFKAYHHVYTTGEPIRGFAMEQIRKDGTRLIVENSVFPMRNEKGEIIGFRGIGRDVTERVQMQEALKQSEERYRTILAEIEEGYYEVDLAGNIKFVNRAACRQFGYSQEELIGSNYRAYVPKEDIKTVFRAWNKVYRTGQPLQSYPFTTIRKDGTQIFVENSVSPVRNKVGTIVGFRAVSRDVTQRKQFEQKLAEMATHDPLTGLPNRSLLSDRLTMGLALTRRNGTRLSLLMLDLDRFKVINDTMGHAVGDQLLKGVAERLTEVTRKSDTVARVGGDEFVLVLPHITSPEDAAKLAQRILDVFQEPFIFDGHQLKITTSIGIAVYPDDGKEIEVLLKNADSAMYRAKEQGRDMFRFFGQEESTTSSKAQMGA